MKQLARHCLQTRVVKAAVLTAYEWSLCRRYVDFPITGVLQMMGRVGGGEVQYNRRGVIVIMVHVPKKSLYK